MKRAAMVLLYNAIAFAALSLYLMRSEEHMEQKHPDWEQLNFDQPLVARQHQQDAKEGARRRDKALDAVLKHNHEWVMAAMKAIRWMAENYETFTTDDVWARVKAAGLKAPKDPRAMGAVMKRARSFRICLPTDATVKSVRPVCHGRPIRVWQSLLRAD